MRVALLTWDFPPVPSGLGRAAHEIAQGLRACGATVEAFDVSQPDGTVRDEGGIAVHGCAPDGPVASWLRRRGAIGHLVAPHAFRRAVLRRHRHAPFDLVEATNWYAPAHALRRGPLPLVVRNSTPAIDAADAGASLRDRLDMRAAHRFERQAARAADALISNTPSHAELIEAIYAPLGDVPHEVVALALDPATLARGAAATLPEGGEPRFLFVGRAERRKGFAEMLGAFALACEAASGDPLVLDLVGVGADDVGRVAAADPLVARWRERVRLAGRVDDDGLHDLYAGATLVLAPSRYESYGLVYREAAAFGRPLVACAEDPAARAFVAEAGCGVLAAQCTAEAIAAAALGLLADAERRRAFHAAGKAHAATLSREALGRRTLEVYGLALARARDRRS